MHLWPHPPKNGLGVVCRVSRAAGGGNWGVGMTMFCCRHMKFSRIEQKYFLKEDVDALK